MRLLLPRTQVLAIAYNPMPCLSRKALVTLDARAPSTNAAVLSLVLGKSFTPRLAYLDTVRVWVVAEQQSLE